MNSDIYIIQGLFIILVSIFITYELKKVVE